MRGGGWKGNRFHGGDGETVTDGDVRSGHGSAKGSQERVCQFSGSFRQRFSGNIPPPAGASWFVSTASRHPEQEG